MSFEDLAVNIHCTALIFIIKKYNHNFLLASEIYIWLS